MARGGREIAALSGPRAAVSLPEIFIVDGRPMALSTDVARYFRKQHKHVLEKIANLLADLPADFAEPNFRLSEFTDSTGRTLPAYRLTRDGFTLLAMGFTGKKALAFKLAYIDAFNEMEAVIAEGKHAPERMNVAYAQAAAVAERAARTVFTAVMAGDDADWRGARWLFCLSASGQTQVIAVPHDALLLRLAELPRQMLEPGTSPTNRELVELAAACNQRLAQRMAHDAHGLLN